MKIKINDVTPYCSAKCLNFLKDKIEKFKYFSEYISLKDNIEENNFIYPNTHINYHIVFDNNGSLNIYLVIWENDNYDSYGNRLCEILINMENFIDFKKFKYFNNFKSALNSYFSFKDNIKEHSLYNILHIVKYFEDKSAFKENYVA